MLNCQKEKFDLDPAVTYLNCAYMSPLLQQVEAAGIAGVSRKRRPHEIAVSDFFEPVKKLKQHFAKLINTPDYERITIVPSVSYGMANVANNLPAEAGQKIILLDEQFPSNYYCWERLAQKRDLRIEIITPPQTKENRAQVWNQKLLAAIDESTLLVSTGHIHWADGTLIDLPAVRKATRAVGAKMVIDGTQSVGALPFDVEELQPDALICGAYKYLMGPYSLGLAYFGPAFDGGVPIEESWANRLNSHEFQNLVNYQPEYQPLAHRYNVGESSNFIAVPMQIAALEQLLAWTPAAIQDYCKKLVQPFVQELQTLGCWTEELNHCGSHLFGVRLPDAKAIPAFREKLTQNQIFVSVRGDAIRVAPNVYNDESDMEKLLEAFKAVV